MNQGPHVVYLQNTANFRFVSSNSDKERLDELIEKVKNFSTKITYLRNQNNQLQVAQRIIQSNYIRENRDNRHPGYNRDGRESRQGYNQGYDKVQLSGKIFERRPPPRKNWTLNTKPNNGEVPTPLDQPDNPKKTTSIVLLVESTLKGYY